ncbi:unnamed protein product, partial [Hapterophycus canaliculatus]
GGPVDARVTPVAREGAQENSGRANAGPADGKENGVAAAAGNAAERSRSRQAERDLIEAQLEKEALALFFELRECTTYHDL